MHIPLVEMQVSVYTPWQIVLVDIPTLRMRVDTPWQLRRLRVRSSQIAWCALARTHLTPSPFSRVLDRNPLSCLCGGREATHDALLSRHRILIPGRQRPKCYVQ